MLLCRAFAETADKQVSIIAASTSACSWAGATSPASARVLSAGGGQRSVEFGHAGNSPAADAQIRSHTASY